MDFMRVPRSPYIADSIIAVGLFVASISLVIDWQASGAEDLFTRDLDPVGVFLIGLMTLPLVFRRAHPVLVLVIVLAAFMLSSGLDYPNSLAGAGTLVAIHAVGSELERGRAIRIGLAVVGIVAVWTAIGASVYEAVGFDDVAFVFLSGSVALYLGWEVNMRRSEVQEIEARAERAERDRQEEAERAVDAERARIARELHDVVAHQMVVMTVQAEGAARLAQDADPRIQDALVTISDTGREGLAEMRRMVGVLRDAGDGGVLAPQPGLSSIDELVTHFNEAGLPVKLSIDGDLDHLPSGVDLNAFRIVQESLTNTLKHGGPGVSASVDVSLADNVLAVEVRDDGRGAATNGNPGHGLVGMRERVAMLGGSIDTGPANGGGFRVRATIPVDPE